MDKLQNNLTSLEASASETFAFPVEQEEQVPQWAQELQKDMDELRSRFDVTDKEETETPLEISKILTLKFQSQVKFFLKIHYKSQVRNSVKLFKSLNT